MQHNTVVLTQDSFDLGILKSSGRVEDGEPCDEVHPSACSSMAVSIRARNPPANIGIRNIGTREHAVHTAALFEPSTRICTGPGDAIRCDIPGKYPWPHPNSPTRDSFPNP